MMDHEQKGEKDSWENELESLGINPKRKNELNDKEELATLADNLKQVYFQDYKTAYDAKIDSEDSKFDSII